MQARFSLSVLLVSVLLLMASPAFSTGGSAPSGQGVSPHCEAAIDKAAGNYSRCLLQARAKYAKSKKKNEDRLLAQAAKCEDKWSNQVARAQDRYGAGACPSSDLVAAMEDRTASCVESLASEAGGRAAATRLYVQDAQAATLSGSLLVLSDVDDETLWFTGRPYRDTGQLPTEDFVALFSEEGLNSFATDPPNADLSCEVDGEVVNRVMTLQNPVRTQVGEDTWDLQYTAQSTEEGTAAGPVSCDGDAHLFIDETTATASACAQSYNCFVGGFCAAAAISFPTDKYGYTNVYTGDTRGAGDALAAGCNVGGGAVDWQSGERLIGAIVEFSTLFCQEIASSGESFFDFDLALCMTKRPVMESP